jgi:DNA-binding XRE family transcriptional regulator
MSKSNDFYALSIWLAANDRSQSWIAKRLEIHKQTITQWKKQNKVPQHMKLAICYVTGTNYEQLWEEV